MAAEALASLLGFVTLLHLARRLGPLSFARVEYAGAVVAWLLVLVRGGADVVAYREAGRRPALVAAWTELLIGQRLIAAAFALAVALALAAQAGAGQGGVIAVASLTLVASCGVADVGPRATGRLGWVALAQATRAIGYLGSVLMLVNGPGQELRAAGCLAGSEALGAAVAWGVHVRHFGRPWPRWRWRAGWALARRGVVTGLTRFARVTLYGLDMLVLGHAVAGVDFGRYAAARRVVYALLGLGLVVPAAVGPAIARAWAAGAGPARREVGRAADRLWTLVLPATLGLVLTADRLVPTLFGSSYEGGGPWLALLAVRLPWLLAGAVAQSTLVACRREGWGLRLTGVQLAAGLLAVPAAAYGWGVTGVAWASLGVEALGAVGGWMVLRPLGLAARGGLPPWPAVAGGLALGGACGLTRSAPLFVTVAAGAGAYGLAWLAAAWPELQNRGSPT